ncbi:MAG: methionine gamma-lyase family protein [Oscillospiraceae bacterium]|nr:methionine gamma-lyase family protein [Oscillospiraceae bacterium]
MDYFNISPEILSLAEKAGEKCAGQFRQIENISARNQRKMLAAFIKNKVSDSHFSATTGYGYNDRGREVLDAVAADAFEAESAILSHNFASGTHAITVALFGILRPGDVMLSVTGPPYDTLRGVVGMGGGGSGSLAEFGVGYDEIELNHDTINIELMCEKLSSNDKIKLIYIQRSRGYTLRRAISADEMGRVARAARDVRQDIIIMADNCYGEFVETTEPTAHGVDIIAGSLIKNPGGGIAPTGGYIAGRADLVEKCADRLTAPGIGREIGCSLGLTRELALGFYHAPRAVGEALKSAVFAAALMEEMGYETSPKSGDPRSDIVQAVKLGSREKLIAFCHGIQSGSPVDSFAAPRPAAMPGYGCEIIMASGSFTQGSSIELSADAPLREPYAVWLQGGLSFETARVGIMLAADGVMHNS